MMTLPFLRWRWGWAALSLCLLTTPMACAADESTVTPPPLAVSSSQEPAFQQLVSADVVYLGERHDSVQDHAAQLEIIASLYVADPDMAIALEMFQRPFQPVIDRYLAGEITEAELVEQTQYLERWGFPWEYYAPFLRFAQTHQLPVLALNAPSEITRQVAREGLDSLVGDDWRYLPPREEIDTSNTDYQNLVRAAFSSHGSHGNFNFENFFTAQVIWDETMALTIAEFRQVHPNTQVVVLAGNGHVVYGYGIPDRVARRLGEEVNQQIVLLNPLPASVEAAGAIADMVWYSPEPQGIPNPDALGP